MSTTEKSDYVPPDSNYIAPPDRVVPLTAVPELHPGWAACSATISQWMAAFCTALGQITDVTKDKEAKVSSERTGKSYTYAYADLASALDVARPVLAANGLAASQCAVTADGVAITWTTIFHASGEWVTFLPLDLPTGRDPQQLGSAITYGRRYSLLPILGMATEDDDAGKAQQGARERRQQQQQQKDDAAGPTYNAGQKRLLDMFRGEIEAKVPDDYAGHLRAAFFKRFGLLAQLPDGQLADAEAWIVTVALSVGPDGTVPVEILDRLAGEGAATAAPPESPDPGPQEPQPAGDGAGGQPQPADPEAPQEDAQPAADADPAPEVTGGLDSYGAVPETAEPVRGRARRG